MTEYLRTLRTDRALDCDDLALLKAIYRDGDGEVRDAAGHAIDVVANRILDIDRQIELICRPAEAAA